MTRHRGDLTMQRRERMRRRRRNKNTGNIRTCARLTFLALLQLSSCWRSERKESPVVCARRWDLKYCERQHIVTQGTAAARIWLRWSAACMHIFRVDGRFFFKTNVHKGQNCVRFHSLCALTCSLHACSFICFMSHES